MKSVGIRELRQNLSVYLRRVQAGETLQVTERGTPVAVLGPVPGTTGALDRLVSRGLARRGRTRPGTLGMPPRPRGKNPVSLSEALRVLRADER